MTNKLFELLACPFCHRSLALKKKNLACDGCRKKYPMDSGIPDFSQATIDDDLKLSREKWDKKYEADAKKKIADELDYLEDKFFKSTLKQISRHTKITRQSLFLEIGCGTFYLGRALAKKGITVIGIDMSMEALKLTRAIFEKEKISNYLLVCGNVLNMPFKDDAIDLIYGAGVIEHFKDTYASIKELYRILKKRGVAYNTVPYLNIGSLTYRQVWGNIPRLPILEDIFAFFHMKILGARHMRFGYELSFTRSYLEKIHKLAGFSQTKTGKFECKLDFDYIKNAGIKKFAVALAKNSPLFWPMIYVAAKK